MTCQENSPLRLPKKKIPQKGNICRNLRTNSISFKIQQGNLNQKRNTVSISISASSARTRTHTHTGLPFRESEISQESGRQPYLRANNPNTLCPSTKRTRVVPKVMSNFFLHANWEQQTKESAVVDGTSCCVILECLVTSIACIT